MKHPAKRRVLYAAAGIPVLGVAVLLAAYHWHSHSLNNWIAEGLHELEPYPHVLIRGGECPADGYENPKDAVLVRHAAEGREVVELTRSEFHRGFFGRGRWVKVLLVTARPGEEESVLRLKLLHQLGRSSSGEWEVRSVEELALP